VHNGGENRVVITRFWNRERNFGGATENAGVENAIRSKKQGWKMREWNMREQIAGMENAGVD